MKSPEQFNPHNQAYKEVSNLPIEEQENFKDVDSGGFITKEAGEYQSILEAEADKRNKKRPILNKVLGINKESSISMAHEEAVNLGNMTRKESDIAKSRMGYENRASQLAKYKNSVVENITGSGLTTEDIIRVDAEIENKTYKELFNPYKTSKLHEKFWMDILEKIRESDLSLKRAGHSLNLEGIINGWEIKITRKAKKGLGRSYIMLYSGTMNGEKIPWTVAKEIFEEYADFAKQRMSSIEDAHPASIRAAAVSAAQHAKKIAEDKIVRAQEKKALDEHEKIMETFKSKK